MVLTCIWLSKFTCLMMNIISGREFYYAVLHLHHNGVWFMTLGPWCMMVQAVVFNTSFWFHSAMCHIIIFIELFYNSYTGIHVLWMPLSVCYITRSWTSAPNNLNPSKFVWAICFPRPSLPASYSYTYSVHVFVIHLLLGAIGRLGVKSIQKFGDLQQLTMASENKSVTNFFYSNHTQSASLRCGPWARHIYPSLVLVQPRKIRPYITEKLLMWRKESNQTNQTKIIHSQTCLKRPLKQKTKTLFPRPIIA